MSIINRSAAGLAALALTVAPAAFAKGPGGDHGKSGQPHGKAGQQHGKARGKTKARNVVVKGTIASVGADTVTVSVAKATKWGRALRGTDAEFTVAKISAADRDGNGTVDLADLAAGDKVVVKARIAKDATAPYAARQLVDQSSPQADDDTQGDDDTTSDQGTGDVTP